MRVLFALSVAFVAGCGDLPQAPGPVAPSTPERYSDFLKAHAWCSETDVGQIGEGRLSLFNRFSRDVTVLSVETTSGSGVSAAVSAPVVVPVDGDAVISLRCAPAGNGRSAQTLIVHAAEGDVVVPVEVVGLAPSALVVLPSEETVPFVPGERYTSVLSLKVVNSGAKPLRLTRAPSVSVGLSPDFDWTSLSVAPGKDARLHFRVAPAAPGFEEHLLMLHTNDPLRGAIGVRFPTRAVVRERCSVRVERSVQPLGSDEVIIQFRNIGSASLAECDLSGFRVEGGAPLTRIVGVRDWLRIPPARSDELRIQGATDSTMLRFYGAADALQPSLIRVLPDPNGCSVVSPTVLDFGTTPAGCERTRSFTVYNTCATAGTMTASLLGEGCDGGECEQFSLAFDGGVVANGAPLTATLRYRPTKIGTTSVNVLWRWERGEAKDEYVTSAIARGDTTSAVQDVFSMPRRIRRDFVIAVGAPNIFSGSATFTQSQLQGFNQVFSPCGLYRAAVVRAGDGGQLVESLDGGATLISGEGHAFWPQVIPRIQQAAQGSRNEVIEALGNAPVLLSTLDAGALFGPTLFTISDRRDFSPLPVGDYSQRVTASWDAGSLVLIAPFSNGSCTGDVVDDGRLASFMPFGAQAQLKSEVCETWNPYIQGGTQCLGHVFFLSALIDPRTMEVSYGDAGIPELTDGGSRNWTYDPVSNAVSFSTGVLDYEGPDLTINARMYCPP